YQTAAKELGFPKKHARAIAQVCDLLDAAAVLKGIPPLALVAVRAASRDFNPKAWVKGCPAGFREAVIKHSLDHTFTDADFEAIKKSLISLEGYGNHAAWKEVKRKIPRSQLFQQLTEVPVEQDQDALNDLGSDKPEKVPTSGSSYARDPKVRKAVKSRAKGQCELCGKRGFACRDGTFYLETHHIISLANDGADRTTNVIALCADHHREAHFGAKRGELEKDMIAKVESSGKA
ncbi:MAG: HNH endonuclease, partial [Kiritimatiellaeota bacterium]|nr:HNH endonuclease [Kiritimatiellota bacterium]